MNRYRLAPGAGVTQVAPASHADRRGQQPGGARWQTGTDAPSPTDRCMTALPPAETCAPDPRIAGLTGQLRLREPSPDDADRWHEHVLDGVRYRCAQPITFTPYAASKPCSARCRFCSETLVNEDASLRAARLRPGPGYFAALQRALAALRGLPLSYSLSGLENTDDADWMLALLAQLQQASRDGVPVDERVLYSNGAGFAGARGAELLAALQAFGLSWIELSRHSHDAACNDAIMRFRPGEAIAGAGTFEVTARRLSAALPLKLVCIVQRGGVHDADGVETYLRFAASLGAREVIFREFSRLSPSYRRNGTARYIEGARVPMDALALDCLQQPALRRALEVECGTRGYYFWNLRLRHDSGIRVVFEASDYARMHQRHDSGRLYKLVLFPNGNLCAGWDPDRNVLLRCDGGYQ